MRAASSGKVAPATTPIDDQPVEGPQCRVDQWPQCAGDDLAERHATRIGILENSSTRIARPQNNNDAFPVMA